MKNTILIMLASFISLVSCAKKNSNENSMVRLVFDPGNLKFISTSLNPQKETMSALYGNQEALESLSKEKTQPKQGSIMKLVTWRYHDNPQYFGGKITGELISVETVLADQQGGVSYGIQNDEKNSNHYNQEKRIQYFMSYRPVVRP
nr:hypothetical protein [uncultured Chryseobacterium sp.]